MRKIIGLVGSSGSGKTRFCEHILQAARQAGKICYGFYCPAVFVHETKAGINTVLISTGEVKSLAKLSQPGSSLAFGKWELSQDTLTWADAWIRKLKRCDVLIIDEIGPLEVYEHRGWASALEVLRQAEFTLGVVTYRPALSKFFTTQFPDLVEVNLDVTKDLSEADQLIQAILKANS